MNIRPYFVKISQIKNSLNINTKKYFSLRLYRFVDRIRRKMLTWKIAFLYNLNKSHIPEAEYNGAVEVFQAFEFQSFREYSDLYLKTDVLIISDVYENFRERLLQSHGLDPVQ